MKSQLYTRSNQGFSIIEILFVLVIIGILSAIAAPSWLAFLNVQRLNAAQDQVYRAMREAQSKAAQEKLTWQASFREHNGIVQWAVHPNEISEQDNNWKNKVTWNNLDPNIRLDSETNLEADDENANDVRRVEFDFRGNVPPPLGRITLSTSSGGRAKKCVIIATILGAIRTSKEQNSPDSDGNYCY